VSVLLFVPSSLFLFPLHHFFFINAMGESRTELLQWVNDLLNINYTKVEQAGTGNRKKEKVLTHLARRPTHSMLSCHPYALLGGAYCQIMDSIYGKTSSGREELDFGLTSLFL
jgi:RP/EB family microtubule-associated protein